MSYTTETRRLAAITFLETNHDMVVCSLLNCHRDNHQHEEPLTLADVKYINCLLIQNGGEFVGVPSSSSNAPLRGAKLSMYEGGFRTPAFIHAPSMIQGGDITDG